MRLPHGVELTDAGRELLDKARVAIEAADDALAVGQPQQPHGRLVLGVPLAGGRRRWFELTQAFVDRYAAVEVEMRQALSEQLQRQVLERELDGAIVLAPKRLDGLRYSHVMHDRVAVYANRAHPLADRRELTLADLHEQTITLLGGPAGRGSGFNTAVHDLVAGSRSAPVFDETSQVFPPSAALDPGYLSVTVPVDYPDGVVSIPLVPPRTLPFVFVQRAETNRSAVRAYARFAAARFAKAYAESIAPS